jgi:hypothetical protein
LISIHGLTRTFVRELLLVGYGGVQAGPGRALRDVAGLVNELVEVADERRLSRLVSRYGRLDL